jgi:Ca2+-binding EF-hand superfamily protein
MHDWQITGQFASCVAGKWDKIAAAFIAFDREQTGSLTYGEVKLILQRLDIIDERMTDANFRILMKHYDSDGDGDISYVEFLKHFASSVDGTHLDQKFAVNERIQPLLAGHENSMVIENDSNFKTVATCKWPKVMRQIKLVADQDSMGFVTKSQFRRILDSCSICLSNAYFEEISQRFEVPVHNNYFLHDLFMQEMGLQRPATASGRPISSMSNSSSVTSLRSAYSNSSLLQKDVSISYLARNGATTESLLSIEKVEKKIQKRMKKDAAKVRNAFDKYDKEGSGLVSRDGFLMSLNSLDLDISPEEASLLWKKHATVVDKGVRFANYRIVLKTMYESQHRNNQSSKNSPSKSLSRGPGSQTWELENIERYFERPKTAVVASKMQMLDSHRCKTICQSWKDIRAQFQQRDRNPASKGTVSSVDFQSVLMWFGVSLDDKEMYKLMLFYDQTNTGRIMYNDFLKAVLKHKVI